MTDEERIIQENMGKQNPFRVPDGYFDRFAEQLMEQLPERQVEAPKRTVLLKIWRPVLLAAACTCVAIFSVTLYLNHSKQQTTTEPAVATVITTTADEDFMDEAADYAMLDNADIYACLSE